MAMLLNLKQIDEKTKDKLTTAGAEYIVALKKFPEDMHAPLTYALIETYAISMGVSAKTIIEELEEVRLFMEETKGKEA